MDWFAIVSSGTFPTPISTNAERAAYAASLGLLGLFGIPPSGGYSSSMYLYIDLII